MRVWWPWTCQCQVRWLGFWWSNGYDLWRMGWVFFDILSVDRNTDLDNRSVTGEPASLGQCSSAGNSNDGGVVGDISLKVKSWPRFEPRGHSNSKWRGKRTHVCGVQNGIMSAAMDTARQRFHESEQHRYSYLSGSIERHSPPTVGFRLIRW